MKSVVVSTDTGVAWSSAKDEREACEEDIKTLSNRVRVLRAEELLHALKVGQPVIARDHARWLFTTLDNVQSEPQS